MLNNYYGMDFFIDVNVSGYYHNKILFVNKSNKLDNLRTKSVMISYLNKALKAPGVVEGILKRPVSSRLLFDFSYGNT